jgi:hypothetical protein
MSTRLVNIDRLTPMLLPPDLKDWVPNHHMVHFILEAIEHLDLSCCQLNWRGSGSEQYPPSTLLALLVYCYATGRFSSRRIEERFKQVSMEKQAAYEAKMKARDDIRRTGCKPRGCDPKPPSQKPNDKAQYNFTDPESRIMKAGQSKAFEQSYNAQAAVDAEGSYLILGQRVTNHCNDKKELKPTKESVNPIVREVTAVLADSGYFSENAIKEIEEDGAMVYAAVEKGTHGRTVADLEKQTTPNLPKRTPV